MDRAGRRRSILILLVGLLAACSSKGSSGDGATAGTVATVPPTTNPYAVPEVIDVAYVNRVLAGLDQVMGDAVRLAVVAKAIPRDALGRLEAIHVNEGSNPNSLVQLAINGFEDAIRRGFPDTREQPGNVVTTVTDLISGTPTCIFAKVNQDRTPASKHPSPAPLQHWIGLVRLDPANDPDRYNPTAWVYIVNGVLSDMSQPENPCVPGS